MDDKKELKARVEAKKKKIEAQLSEMKASATGTANETRKRLKKDLEDLQTHLKDGWENLSEGAARKLNELTK